ncbi:MAG: sodium-dependent bicarbonate transport family permease [Acidobacteria bacterium]|jgi:hypothetical protein|nr:sodium-dependent bicarbonate transport family permease [Acidobacteriota bacterium]
MEILELARVNLLSPVVLAFLLGVIATRVKSDLEIPEPLVQGLAIYLLLAIGIKGGAALSETTLAEVAWPALATLLVGVTIPLVCYTVLRRLGRMSASDAGAIAAAFGSVSVVTFIAANTLAQQRGTPPEGFMPALVAILEVPGILVALGLAASAEQRKEPWGAVLREMLFGQSIVCLLGGLVIGWVAGKPGLDEVAGFFVTPFKGALVLFLLELGMVAAKRLRDLRAAGPFLVGFGLVAAPVFGVVGVFAGQLAGLSPAGAAVMGAMAGSASYIAAPAAVRAGLPDANPAYYLPLALGVVFPFNLTIGIPLYYELAKLTAR